MTTRVGLEEDVGVVEFVGAITVKLVVLKIVVCVVGGEFDVVTVVAGGIVEKLPILRDVVLLGVVMAGVTIVD